MNDTGEGIPLFQLITSKAFGKQGLDMENAELVVPKSIPNTICNAKLLQLVRRKPIHKRAKARYQAGFRVFIYLLKTVVSLKFHQDAFSIDASNVLETKTERAHSVIPIDNSECFLSSLRT